MVNSKYEELKCDITDKYKSNMQKYVQPEQNTKTTPISIHSTQKRNTKCLTIDKNRNCRTNILSRR